MATLYWNVDKPEKRYVLSGNEAAARGALEGGVRMVTSYPGSPSVQVLECLATVAQQRGLYAEWSINEKVALEVAAAGSFAGLRSLCVMKADGLNVAMDFLTALPLSGIGAGLVIIVSDDPGAHSSVKEEDSRYLAPPAHIPLMEPATPEETKDMVAWAFAFSEQVGLPVIVRLVTRICHARATLSLGAIQPSEGVPRLQPEMRFVTAGSRHENTHQSLDKAAEGFAESPFNIYSGPEKPELTIVTSGVSYLYAQEAVERLGVEGRVGIVKVGTIWPLPEKLVLDNLKRSEKILFLEEIEPFLEDQVKIFAAQHWNDLGRLRFLGKRSGDVPWVMKARGMGELDPDIATQALAKALTMDFQQGREGLREKAEKLPKMELPQRLPILCAGCPHRASYWAIKTALALDGREGFVVGDIGCYTLGALPGGYQTLSTVHCMGSGTGLASGFGKLSEAGFQQPPVAVIGDSTFYHAGIPPLINAKVTGSQFLLIVLDNDTTAMTGHQPHAGTGILATGEVTFPVPMVELVRSLDIPVTIQDPYEVHETTETILYLLREGGLHVLILRQACALKAMREQPSPPFYVDQDLCLGDACGCARLCSRVFSCPANIWDEKAGRARIDEVLCTGCGVCASLCPEGAIKITREGERHANTP